MSSSDLLPVVHFPGRRQALAAAAALLLAGCGFELRAPPKVRFSSITLAGFAPRSPLAEALRHSLQAQQVRIVEPPATAEVVLLAIDDVRERSVVASTAAAQVRDLQLRLRFNFRVQTGTGRELIPRAELLLARDLSYSEVAALAKEYEEGELYREMQDNVVVQVMRRLAAINP